MSNTGRISERFAAARAADALELEQGLLRLTNVSVVGVYFLVAFLWDRFLDDGEAFILLAMVVILAAGVAHLSWILARPGVNQVRRRCAVLLDMASITTGMALAGLTGAMLYGLYLWVVIGNGFRFGRWYLHYAQAMSLVGFTAVTLLSDFWRQHLMLASALGITLLIVPQYVSLLIKRVDATTRRLEEARSEAEAANIAKSKFLAAASHDLRQPMQALSMYASVLDERTGDADAKRAVHGIQLSVTNLEQMFDSLLDISKIEAGVVKPNVVAFPVMPLIEHVVQGERAMAAHKGLELRTVKCTANVLSDPVLLERMLRNLVTNAIRYTQRGGIIVGCRRVQGGRLRMEVIDSGIGIALEEQERIFDEYYQLSGKSAQGLGLGLPIVKSLGELLGHNVAVRSAQGQGSVFSIELERAFVETMPAPARSSPVAALDSLKVVLVDDDAEIRESMRLLIEGWGCHSVTGATVGEIEEQLHAKRLTPDALIVDYRLAGAMSGVQVIERLRASYGAELPALIITGTPSPGFQSRAAGIPFAIKPVAPGKLRAFLSHAVRA